MPQDAPADEATAHRSDHRPRRWGAFALTAGAVVIADQLSKQWVETEFGLAGSVGPTPILGDFVRIAKGYNDGGIFGLFGDSAAILGMASIFVIALIVFYQARHGVSSGPLLSVTLGLLMGGAVGNLIDRLSYGHVIDFVDMGIGTLRFYTFNVADSAISVAVVLLLAVSLLGDRLPGVAAEGEAR